MCPLFCTVWSFKWGICWGWQASLMEQPSLTERLSRSQRDSEIRSSSDFGGRPGRRAQSHPSHGNLNFSNASSPPPASCYSRAGGGARPTWRKSFAMGRNLSCLKSLEPFDKQIHFRVNYITGSEQIWWTAGFWDLVRETSQTPSQSKLSPLIIVVFEIYTTTIRYIAPAFDWPHHLQSKRF